MVNDFACRSFRDVADHDYIAARMAYRTMLFPQFQWSALQAVEKYLKGILLLNRVSAKNVRHDLAKALERAAALPFPLKLSPASRAFIEYLDRSARFRYLESSYSVTGPKIVELDRTVWEVRRYCRSLNYDIRRSDGTVVNLLKAELATIDAAERRPYHKFRILGGRLEKILSDRGHPARGALIWKNLFFGERARKKVQMDIPRWFENAPLSLHPEILEEVLKYVYLPKDVASAYRAELASQLAAGDGEEGSA